MAVREKTTTTKKFPSEEKVGDVEEAAAAVISRETGRSGTTTTRLLLLLLILDAENISNFAHPSGELIEGNSGLFQGRGEDYVGSPRRAFRNLLQIIELAIRMQGKCCSKSKVVRCIRDRPKVGPIPDNNPRAQFYLTVLLLLPFSKMIKGKAVTWKRRKMEA